ncbi:Uncharacterised protein [Halioglobus japonicus]|nr:Uncharacterised protein [Halioglobus japonicus]
MKIRRGLYLAHRWLGIVLCLFIAMWFFSGVVMMYIGFPSLTLQERLEALPALNSQTIQVSPAAVLAHAEENAGIDSLHLSSVLGRPAYLLRTDDGSHYQVFADTGEPFEYFDAESARLAAQIYANQRGMGAAAEITYLNNIEMDQWSSSSAFQRHRPLHLIALHDAADTQLYISSRTGQVLRDTSRNERAWNWLGANLHWLYPMQLRRHATLWHWVVVILSLAGLVAIISGAIVGCIRLRLRKPYRGTHNSPYRGTMKLHHILGLFCLIPLTTFMFSGLMSMNPWGVFTDDISYRSQFNAYRASPTIAAALGQKQSLLALREGLDKHRDSREMVWQWLGGQAYQYTISGDNRRQPLTAPPEGVEQLRTVMQGHDITAIEQLNTYDSYYYSHHENWRPLPVLRVRFNDPAQTWFHFDLQTSEMLNRLTTTGRIKRWLYNGLHSLDFTFLIHNRPLWDLVVIALSVTGFVFAVTSVVIGWRRLRGQRNNRLRNRLRNERRQERLITT